MHAGAGCVKSKPGRDGAKQPWRRMALGVITGTDTHTNTQMLLGGDLALSPCATVCCHILPFCEIDPVGVCHGPATQLTCCAASLLAPLIMTGLCILSYHLAGSQFVPWALKLCLTCVCKHSHCGSSNLWPETLFATLCSGHSPQKGL